jgi:aspartate racemase
MADHGNDRSAKTIGIVGGLSPESTVTYYQTIVRRHVAEVGDHSYPRIVVASVSFQDYIDWQHSGAWHRIAAGLEDELQRLSAAGAELAVLASNTVHKVFDELRSPIPLLPVFDAVAAACPASARRLGLTGTRFTMADGFFARAMAERGIDVITPPESEQEALHRIIYDELIRGVASEPARARLAAIAGELAARGADAVLLACTELQLLAGPPGLGVPIIDTATCHAELAWRTATGRVASQ